MPVGMDMRNTGKLDRLRINYSRVTNAERFRPLYSAMLEIFGRWRTTSTSSVPRGMVLMRNWSADWTFPSACETQP